MSIVVNNNIASLNAQRNLSINTKSLSKSFERLSSGYRINSASDDAAGLSISEGLRSQIRGNDQAIKNIQDGSNMLQIAEGGLSVINDNLQRIRELSVQAANDTYGTAEKAAILSEIDQRLQDITRTAKTATFNGIQLLSAATSKTVLQVGAGSAASVNTLDLKAALPNATATSLKLDISTISASTWTGNKVRSFLSKIDAALTTVISKRSILGAYQNRLDSSLQNMTVMNENLTASESRIRDLDIAKETASRTKYQILQPASVSILSQSNKLPQLALSLLQ